MIGNRAEVYNRSRLASSSSVAALQAEPRQWRQTGIRACRLDSTFGRRAYRAAGTNAALGPALSHRREHRNVIAARWRLSVSITAVINCDSHNYLLTVPELKNTHSDIQKSRVENISLRAAIVFNIGCWRGLRSASVHRTASRKNAGQADAGCWGSGRDNGIYSLARRNPNEYCRITSRCRSGRRNRVTAKPLIMRGKTRMLQHGWHFPAHLL